MNTKISDFSDSDASPDERDASLKVEAKFFNPSLVVPLAGQPFAYVEVNGAIPTTNFTPPVLNPNWTLVGSVSWSAIITYNDHGRNDSSPSFSGTSPVWSPIAIDFQGIVQGGRIKLTLTAKVQDIHTGVREDFNWTGSNEIRGRSPTKDAIKARVGDVSVQVIAYKESRFRQFGDDSWPIFGPPSGFGVMQLDPPGPARQIWDWMQNVDEGKGRFQSSQSVARQHYINLRNEHPTLPALSADDLKRAAYQYYNAGNNGFYWLPKADFTGWIRNPNSAFTDYGDDAMRIEALVVSGQPPTDW